MREAFGPNDAHQGLLYALKARARFLEFDCGMDRSKAKQQAFGEIVKRNENSGADLPAPLGEHWPRDFDARQETLAFREIFKLER